MRADFASVGTTNDGKYSGRLCFPSRDPTSRCCLDGNSHSSRSTARNFPAGGFGGRPELLPSSVPCESVILVWYQRNSRAACLLSFRCNNERPWMVGGSKKDGKRERRERQRYLSSVFSFTATLLAPDRDKAAGITLFPQRLSPSIAQILLTRVFAHNPFHHLAHSASSFLSFLFFPPFLSFSFPPDVYTGTTYSHIIFSMDFAFLICSQRTRQLSICRVKV